MVRLIRDGVIDLIGAARPSIADPFLPRQDRGGTARGHPRVHRLQHLRHRRLDDRRRSAAPRTRPWARSGGAAGIPSGSGPKGSDANVLVVGAGPAGLEAAQALGKRGYEVMLAEATRELGGRVLREARLPGLAAWIRVVDYRKRPARAAPERRARARERGHRRRGARATASTRRRRDRRALARRRRRAAPHAAARARRGRGADARRPASPAGVPQGDRVVVFDDDHYYLGGVLAELLAGEGRQVTIVTPAGRIVSAWSVNTMEQPRIQRRLLELGVELELVARSWSGRRRRGAASSARTPSAAERSPATRWCSSRRACRTTASARSCSHVAASGRRPVSIGAHRRRRLRAGHDRDRGLGRPTLRRGARRSEPRTMRCRTGARSPSSRRVTVSQVSVP